MSALRILAIMSILPIVSACSGGCGQSDKELLQCWTKGTAELANANVINFEAVAVPRQGVIAGSPSCPFVRLQFRLSKAARDRYGEMLRGNGLHMTGLRGVAAVVPVRRQSSCVLLVDVNRLIKIDVLSEAETKRIWDKLGRR
jgi:hypothetical protein